MADMEHEQCYKSAITITEPPGQHTEYTRRGELRHPGLARDAARGSSRSRAMDGSVQLRARNSGPRAQKIVHDALPVPVLMKCEQ